MIAVSVSVTGLRVVGSAIRDGPEALRVAARLRLISVTMALFVGYQHFTWMIEGGLRIV